MKTLYLIRHAKSSWEFDVTDDKRPLNSRGLKDADLIGNALKTLIKPIDKILCSPAERAHMTAKIILPYLDVSDDVFSLEPDLYDFSGQQVTEVIKNCDDSISTLLIFGHNHAFTSIANLYGSEIIDNVPTTGVVGIEFDVNHWKNINVGKTLLKLFPKSLK
ncbi:SixA phosphatase family protein [Aquimarina sp. 2201CG5-10]|uniref:SixA phosphatase family protein n=1 Tax=Aquimarina callyspongiae TaxID=3098150 RepID=UPI002AB48F06|nr:histidine phosphatase family protein [Aquimarina sp. 2201CG5-10]MDY8135767.1 histidine phosphatase family protein [Aquimarina sp. 2201CG5-10]